MRKVKASARRRKRFFEGLGQFVSRRRNPMYVYIYIYLCIYIYKYIKCSHFWTGHPGFQSHNRMLGDAWLSKEPSRRRNPDFRTLLSFWGPEPRCVIFASSCFCWMNQNKMDILYKTIYTDIQLGCWTARTRTRTTATTSTLSLILLTHNLDPIISKTGPPESIERTEPPPKADWQRSQHGPVGRQLISVKRSLQKALNL